MKKPADTKKTPTRRREQMRTHLAWIEKRAKDVPAWQMNTKTGKPAEPPAPLQVEA